MAVKPIAGKRGKKSRRVRLEDIAEACGVSLSTASRAIAGEKGVRPEIRHRVLEAAKVANYVIPTAVAGQKVILAASSAAMIDYVRNQFTLYVLEGLKERAQALGLEIVTRPIADRNEELAVLKEAQDDPQVAGLLFLTVDDEGMLAATRGFDKPVVLLNSDDPFMRLSSVTPCNRSSARLAADHLIGLGHQRILFLMRPGRRTIERRYEGWKDALLHHGLAADADLIVPVEDWLPELAAQAIASRIEARGLDFTAGRRRQFGRRRDDGRPAAGLFGAGRCVRHGHGRPAAGVLPQPAADDDAHPDARDRLGRARPFARQPVRPADAAAPRRTRLPSGRARFDGAAAADISAFLE